MTFSKFEFQPSFFSSARAGIWARYESFSASQSHEYVCVPFFQCFAALTIYRFTCTPIIIGITLCGRALV